MKRFLLVIVTAVIGTALVCSCSQPRKGFDYRAHAKSNAKWVKRAETGKLPKCNRH